MWPKLIQGLKRNLWQWRAVLITSPVVACLAIAAGSAGFLQNLEWAMLDRFFSLRPKQPLDPRIVIVAIDEPDITYVGQWPMPDRVLAELIEKIKQQEPRAIGLDLYRDLPVEPGHEILRQTFESTPNLIGVEKIIGDPVAPPPTLQRLNRVGIADLVLDGDGKVRRALMSHKNKNNETRLSLGALLSLMYLEKEGIGLKAIDSNQMHLGLGKAVFKPFRKNDGGYVRSNAGGYQILINYRGGKENFQTVSIRDVLQGQIPPDLMRDRIVLIGAIAPSLKDLFFTPYSSGLFSTPKRTPGVVIHGNLISQILGAAIDGRPLIQVWSEPLEWLWIFAWSWVGAAVAWKLRTRSVSHKKVLPGRAVAGVLLAGGALLGSSYLAFLASWWIPPVSALVALSGSALAIVAYQGRQLQRENERRLTQFLEAMPVGIGVLDAKGRPYFVNKKAKEILGKGVAPDAKTDEMSEVYQNYIAGTDRIYPSENLPVVRALRGEYSTADDIEVRQGDKIIPIEAWGTPIRDEFGKVAFALVAFQDITERKKAEDEKKEFTEKLIRFNQAYERFVPRQFLQILNKESIVDVELGEAVEKEMSILFADIRHFTTLSEKMLPEENFQFINSYLSTMEPAILENNGFIDKYIGDAIMALFGGSPDDAVKAGIAMLERLKDYNNSKLLPHPMPIKIGIGIHTGLMMLGTVGGKQRMDGTAIGDAVNLAARVESLTKNYGVPLLITHQTFLGLDDVGRYKIRLVDRVQVKGKTESATVYEVFDADKPNIRESKIATRSLFEKAVLLYHLGSCTESAHLFSTCLKDNPGDRVAQIYLERLQRHTSRSHPSG
ncbi:MAG: CHASE2 domain-containing protein [Oscillatoria sp. SIO1A7]|nr:CHASE2 domain-containing protein [Oscillatoria sp. SIO1A7]